MLESPGVSNVRVSSSGILKEVKIICIYRTDFSLPNKKGENKISLMH